MLLPLENNELKLTSLAFYDKIKSEIQTQKGLAL